MHRSFKIVLVTCKLCCAASSFTCVHVYCLDCNARSLRSWVLGVTVGFTFAARGRAVKKDRSIQALQSKCSPYAGRALESFRRAELYAIRLSGYILDEKTQLDA